MVADTVADTVADMVADMVATTASASIPSSHRPAFGSYRANPVRVRARTRGGVVKGEAQKSGARLGVTEKLPDIKAWSILSTI